VDQPNAVAGVHIRGGAAVAAGVLVLALASSHGLSVRVEAEDGGASRWAGILGAHRGLVVGDSPVALVGRSMEIHVAAMRRGGISNAEVQQEISLAPIRFPGGYIQCLGDTAQNCPSMVVDKVVDCEQVDDDAAVVVEDTNAAACPVEVADDPDPQHIVRGPRATLTCLRLLEASCLCDDVSDGGAHQSRLAGG
jgi:hypothetical protein